MGKCNCCDEESEYCNNTEDICPTCESNEKRGVF